MDLKIHPSKIFYSLLVVIAVLTGLNFIGIGITHYADLPKVEEHLVRLIDFDKERNIPSFYSALAIMLAGILLLYISAIEKKYNGKFKHWLGLAFLFIFLSMDEAVSIHELFSGPTRSLLNLDGALYLAWVVPYGVLACGLLVTYLRFLVGLSPAVRMLFMLGGFIFVSGAVGFELLGSNYHYIGNADDPGYALIYTLEELFEMVGIAVFVYGLLFYVQTELKGYKLTVTVAKPVQPVASQEKKVALKEEVAVASA